MTWPEVLRVLTADDLLAAGACRKAVISVAKRFKETALTPSELLTRLEMLQQRKWILQAARLDGFCSETGAGSGFGFGFGFGSVDGFGDADADGDVDG